LPAVIERVERGAGQATGDIDLIAELVEGAENAFARNAGRIATDFEGDVFYLRAEVRCLAERIVPMEGARTLVATLKARGCRTVLVTGGFHHFADPVAQELGFERVIGNRLAVHEGKLTGRLVGAITGAAAKEAALREEMAKLGDNAASLATGDGANDIPMLAAATYGVAYRAKPKARAAANGWADRGDLTSLLKLLDIPERDWVLG